MIGMHFLAFLTLLIISFISALIIHYGFHYRFLEHFDGFLWKWVVAWCGAWLGSPVLGDWFDGFKVGPVYIIPAFVGAFVGGFLAAAIFKAGKKMISSSGQPMG